MQISSCTSSPSAQTPSINEHVRRYGMRYHGQMALQIALLVAFTQLIPEHQVQVFGFIKARVKVRILLTS